ncbi:NAD(P)H-dependent flavin oxidoreductase [Exiguobacterium artemiae]|uniref:NAD(P)H-dependent flavin oxidoreductase n=1 Tax=Exiguobacterium artemiae TaxID=340145 RepID=UPI002964CAC7|nr:nitronate monooxygenase [Exiguobacterium sibiricum]MDW2884737.1 nitronate monooxygenase [Exiguobacterium sibiricum]
MSRLCSKLQIDVPIIQGGMGNISHAELTAAVSNAGGLGTIGCGTMPPAEVRQLIEATRRLTSRPFALNIAIRVSPHAEQLVELAIEERIPVVSLSAGNPAPFLSKLKQAGIQTIGVVASVKQAIKAEQAGIDVLVAEGVEAAGINSPLELTTMTLIPQIADHVTIPVLAAGGIGDGRGLAAAWMLGAEGVQLGTRLIATQESRVHEQYKQHLVQADDLETRIIGREVGQVRRVLNGPYVEALQPTSLAAFQEQTTESFHIKGALEGDETAGYVNAGLISGLIDDVPTVAELFNRMMDDAFGRIERMYRTLQ